MLYFVTLLTAVDRIYELGFELVESDFVELTQDMYEAAWRNGFSKDLKLYYVCEQTLRRHGHDPKNRVDSTLFALPVIYAYLRLV